MLLSIALNVLAFFVGFFVTLVVQKIQDAWWRYREVQDEAFNRAIDRYFEQYNSDMLVDAARRAAALADDTRSLDQVRINRWDAMLSLQNPDAMVNWKVEGF